MTVYLIRHGKTAANERGLYCGSTDLPLSETGRAELLERHYRLPSHIHFLTSGMRRTDETLRILFGAVDYTVDRRFREVDFGVFEMGSYAELKDNPAYQEWITGDNEANVPPGGESGNQMRERVLAALSDLREDTCLVTHGGVIAAIMSHLFPEEGKSRYDWQRDNGEGYVIENGTYHPVTGKE